MSALRPLSSGSWLWVRGLGAGLLSLSLWLQPLELQADEPLVALSTQGERSAERLLLGASPEATPLVRHLLRVAWEGGLVPIKLIPELDGALEALRDQVITAAVFVAVNPPHAEAIPIARSSLQWVTRGDQRRLSLSAWLTSLTGGSAHEPNQEGSSARASSQDRLQLCLRALPDPLEEAWVALHPEQGALLQRAREEGRALIFYDDQRLLKHLARQTNAVALFDLGRLRLFGAPLAQLQIEGQRRVPITLWYLEASHSGSPALDKWGGFLRRGDQNPWLRDLGWRRP